MTAVLTRDGWDLWGTQGTIPAGTRLADAIAVDAGMFGPPYSWVRGWYNPGGGRVLVFVFCAAIRWEPDATEDAP